MEKCRVNFSRFLAQLSNIVKCFLSRRSLPAILLISCMHGFLLEVWESHLCYQFQKNQKTQNNKLPSISALIKWLAGISHGFKMTNSNFMLMIQQISLRHKTSLMRIQNKNDKWKKFVTNRKFPFYQKLINIFFFGAKRKSK